MEALVLAGLLGAGYVVSRVVGNKVPRGNSPEELKSQGLAQAKVNEGFYPAQRGPDSQALTQTRKGSSVVGFGPELDMMYQT
jgi:hypothetical protein